jgi:Secretion system C-terminal sorting domain/FG-GAP repeat
MKTKLITILVLMGILIPDILFAQYTQQGLKLVGQGAVGNARQGSVSISSDGNTAIIGGWYDNNTAGAAWIFTRNNGAWTQQGSKLVGLGTDQYSQFGWSVAISSDGNTAIMGSPGDGNNGGAWIFIRNNGVWAQQGSKLVGSGVSGYSQQGVSVAISADGNTAVVGSKYEAFWVFTRKGGIWSQQGSMMYGTGADGNTSQGTSVAVSADGNTIVEGGPADSHTQGAIWVFTRTDTTWTQQGPKLVASDAVYASQGTSVAISGDGNTIIEGGSSNNGSEGGVWIFTRNNGVWTEQGQELVGSFDVGSTNNGNWEPVLQGSSVAISADGNTVVEGGYGDNLWKGAVWVFTRTNGVWLQVGFKLSGSDTTGNTIYQGISVAISGDGKTVIEGGNCDNSWVGAAWVFFNPTAGISQTDASIPAKFNLEQNYPNPFNPGTKISWQLPTRSLVLLKVYDIIGNEVAALVNGEKPAGNYEVNFNASKLSSGIYFYRLQAGSFIDTKKMLLLK